MNTDFRACVQSVCQISDGPATG